MSLKDKFDSLGKKASSIKNELFKWLKRIFFYSVLAVVVIAISHYVFSYFGFLHTDIDSARYMLSALVQGEAAIVALVVTLSLIAVQLAAQSYSARVIEVFRKAPDLWILMGIYGIAIFYGLSVLKLINQDNISDFEIYVSGAYYFGIFAFMALVPYILKIFDLLKASSIIKLFAEDVANEKILLAINNQKTSNKDPIQPIVDIVFSSFTNHDYDTIREGLGVIYKNAFEILEDYFSNNKKEDSEKILKHIFSHFIRVARVAINKNDEISLQELITNMGLIGKAAANKKFDEITIQIIESIVEIGEMSHKYKLRDASIEIIDSLANIGLEAARHKQEKPTLKVIYFIKTFGSKLTDDKYNGKGLASDNLREIQKIAKENELEDTLKTIGDYTDKN